MSVCCELKTCEDGLIATSVAMACAAERRLRAVPQVSVDAGVVARRARALTFEQSRKALLKCRKTSLTTMTWFRFAATGQCLLLLGQQAGASAVARTMC